MFGVLVATDEAANRRIAERLLCKLGIPRDNITLLESGEDFVSAFASHRLTGTSIAFLDIQMGKLSGVDVMNKLPRPLPFPVVACTSYTNAEARAEFEGAGFTGLLGKPFAAKDMKKLLNACLISGHGGFVSVP